MTIATKIIIAGGKTGGHLFPGIAVANALERLGENIDILFVGTKAPFEIQTLEKYNFAHTSIISRPIKGGNIFSKAFSMGFVALSLIQSLFLLRRVKPGFVLGVGGFSSFAVVLGAWLLRIPTAIQEQNAFPGLTNRMLSRFARTIFSSFENTRGFKDHPKVKWVGNPVRRSAGNKNLQNADLQNMENTIFDPDKFTLLVTGGSQGASRINAAFIDAMKMTPDAASTFNIIHQTGIADETRIQDEYKQMQLPVLARAFFDDMPKLQDLADLVITRAGAGTLSELCTKGKPAILVPYPHAADDHQTFNAKALEEQNAAVMINDSDLTGPVLKQQLDALIKDQSRITQMGQMMKKLAMPDADEKIAGHILETMKVRG